MGWFENKPRYCSRGVVYWHPKNSAYAINDFNANLNMMILSQEKRFIVLQILILIYYTFMLEMKFVGIQICF